MSGEALVRAVVVDDVAEDLKYAARLSRNGLSCRGILAPPSLDALRVRLHQEADSGNLDALILDYRLDDRRWPEATESGYRGGSVAAEMKEQFPEKPVVLLTTELKLREWLQGRPRVRDLFDLQVLKGQLRTSVERDRAASQVVSLVEGFRTLASTTREGGEPEAMLASVMKARPPEAEAIAVATGGSLEPRVDELSQWISRQVLQFPGILLDPNETRVRLGLTEDDFQRPEVRAFIKSAEYAGIFSAISPRWWRSRIDEIVSNLAAPPPDRSARIAASVGLEGLVVARCIWCGSGDVVRPCSLCYQSVDSRHHLARAENRPRWAEPPIVCFDCIQQGRADNLAIAPGSESFFQKIKDGLVERPSPDQSGA